MTITRKWLWNHCVVHSKLGAAKILTVLLSMTCRVARQNQCWMLLTWWETLSLKTRPVLLSVLLPLLPSPPTRHLRLVLHTALLSPRVRRTLVHTPRRRYRVKPHPLRRYWHIANNKRHERRAHLASRVLWVKAVLALPVVSLHLATDNPCPVPTLLELERDQEVPHTQVEPNRRCCHQGELVRGTFLPPRRKVVVSLFNLAPPEKEKLLHQLDTKEQNKWNVVIVLSALPSYVHPLLLIWPLYTISYSISYHHS